jgi:multidrug efflux pump subunit AcrB
VIATFRLDRNLESAAQDVRDRVNTLGRQLPEDATPPVVQKFDNDSTPVLTIALTADRSIRELTELADKTARPQLERIAGVGEVRIVGGLDRAINVWIDAERLAAYQISISQIRQALERQNTDVPGGNVTTGKEETDAADARALHRSATVLRSRDRKRQRSSGQAARRGPRRGRNERATIVFTSERRADSYARHPPPVRREHRRSHQGFERGAAARHLAASG